MQNTLKIVWKWILDLPTSNSLDISLTKNKPEVYLKALVNREWKMAN